MKKKILFITEALWFGGIETALINLLNHIDYERYDVTLLLQWAIFDGDMRQRIPDPCKLITADRKQATYRYNHLYHLTEKTENPSRLHRAMMWAVPAIKWVENRLYIRYVREQMQGEHFDTCVIYSDRTAETAVRAIDADRYLLFYHHGAMRREYHDEIGYKKAEKIIAVSHAVEQKLRAFRPKYSTKMLTIHNLTDIEGIRAKATAPIPEQFAENQFHIVSCGRVSHEKGMDLAVEACARLVAMGHENIRWWIIGDGPAMGDVRAKVAQLHMDDHVTFLGMQKNPYPYIATADLYVQPSRFESYGLTIAEAMVLEKNIVSTNTDGAKELSQQFPDQILCAIDASSIAHAIRRAIHVKANTASFCGGIAEKNRVVMEQLEKLL